MLLKFSPLNGLISPWDLSELTAASDWNNGLGPATQNIWLAGKSTFFFSPSWN